MNHSPAKRVPPAKWSDDLTVMLDIGGSQGATNNEDLLEASGRDSSGSSRMCYPASDGCVRLPKWDMDDLRVRDGTDPMIPDGTRVYIY